MIMLAAAVIALAAAARAQPPLYHLARIVPLGGMTKWDYLTFDAASDRLFVSHGDEVTVVNGATGSRVGALAGLPGSHGIAVDPASGNIFADSAARSLVVVFSPKTLRAIATAPVLPDADGINYDPSSRAMFVSGGDGNGITVVGAATQKPVATIPLGTSPEFHVADGAGHEFVDLVDANAIARIDTPTDKITARWPVSPCVGPKGLAIDPRTERLFASCANGVAVVLNAASGAVVARLPIGRGADTAVFDPANRRFFSSNSDGSLTVVAERGPAQFAVIATVATAPGARTMAVDPRSGRIFLVTATVTKMTPPAGPDDHPHYSYAPGSLKLLILDPTP